MYLENIFNYLPVYQTDDKIDEWRGCCDMEYENNKEYYNNLVKECNERRMEYEKKDDGEKLYIMTCIL